MIFGCLSPFNSHRAVQFEKQLVIAWRLNVLNVLSLVANTAITQNVKQWGVLLLVSTNHVKFDATSGGRQWTLERWKPAPHVDDRQTLTLFWYTDKNYTSLISAAMGKLIQAFLVHNVKMQTKNQTIWDTRDRVQVGFFVLFCFVLRVCVCVCVCQSFHRPRPQTLRSPKCSLYVNWFRSFEKLQTFWEILLLKFSIY